MNEKYFQLSNVGKKSKNIVCYSESDFSDLDEDEPRDEQIQQQNQSRKNDAWPNENSELKQSKIPVLQANGMFRLRNIKHKFELLRILSAYDCVPYVHCNI